MVFFVGKYSVLKVFDLLYDKRHNTKAIRKDFKLLLRKGIQTCMSYGKKTAAGIT